MSRCATWIAGSTRWWRSSWARSDSRAPIAIPRRRSRSAVSHSAKAASRRWKPFSRSPRYSAAALAHAAGVASATRRSNVWTSTSKALRSRATVSLPIRSTRWAGVGKHLAERRERLSEALACLGLWSVAPQEGREPFPGTGPARGKREVREQRHGFLRDVERLSGGKMPVDSTEKRQAQLPHGPYPLGP